ncbi:DUF2690 domain-containing protein [Polymorphospora sp. NPDC051019]|uniref:DUF2690 domain-containing protein n=1 Tax=Polymorphospora sp. NPDC051019 TaxID=3155725 RepID=UPI003445A2F8
MHQQPLHPPSKAQGVVVAPNAVHTLRSMQTVSTETVKSPMAREPKRRALSRWLVVLLVAAVAGTTGTLVPARPALAGKVEAGCWGDWCSGRDPEETRCSADAYTVASAGIPWSGGLEVELRWSPTCQTNWARVNYGAFSFVRAVQSGTGYTQDYSATNGTYWWSRMIYSPDRCVKASTASVLYTQVDTWCV